jgi:pimeloyl-ACP methyl ester carboxylesterase
LNYSDPDGGHYNLALIRKRAVVPPESGFYRGPVLFNPGGPGGSGVDMIKGPRGDQFSAILGPQFDILSFDPRGTAHTSSIMQLD